MEKRRACITGVSGQDGTYLSALLFSKGYDVYGIDALDRVPPAGVKDYRVLDIGDHDVFSACLKEIQPHECYHLAAQHRSSASAVTTTDGDERMAFTTNVLSVHTMLHVLRHQNPDCRVFLAGSCHMFGEAKESPQTEQTAFAPTNLYGVTKVAATLLGRMYRDREKMFVCTGILCNHESPLRSMDFVTMRIAQAAVDISRGKATELVLGNLGAMVDWGFAGDYVRAMHMMMCATVPEDFVIATGELHSVGEFAACAFTRVGLDWKMYTREDANVYRPVAQTVYRGDAQAIRQRLGWRPERTFQDLVCMMVDHCLDAAKNV